MYENFFQFRSRPFAAAPLVERYFAAQAIEQARQTLTRVVERCEGPGLVVGPSGTGKTLLCHLLANQFRGPYRVALLAGTRASTRKALLQSILFELGLFYDGLEEGELNLTLTGAVEPSPECQRGLVLLVDEAHALPFRLLEEVRMLTNIVRDGQPRVHLILSGTPRLEEKFAHPKMEAFHQRLAARCYLQSLSREETYAYARHQLQLVGGQPEAVFTDAALRVVFTATDGIPRLINQVCDHALVLAALGGRAPIDADGVEEAWADLQQLPAPWPRETVRQEIVEFGALTDEPSGSGTPAATYETAGTSADSTAPEFGPWTSLDRFDIAPTVLTYPADFGQTAEVAAPTAGSQFAGSQFTGSPAVGVQPEVELVFEPSNNPFEETFAEEEVIDNRAAAWQPKLELPRHTTPIETGRTVAFGAIETHTLPLGTPSSARENTAHENTAYESAAALAAASQLLDDELAHDEPIGNEPARTVPLRPAATAAPAPAFAPPPNFSAVLVQGFTADDFDPPAPAAPRTPALPVAQGFESGAGLLGDGLSSGFTTVDPWRDAPPVKAAPIVARTAAAAPRFAVPLADPAEDPVLPEFPSIRLNDEEPFVANVPASDLRDADGYESTEEQTVLPLVAPDDRDLILIDEESEAPAPTVGVQVRSEAIRGRAKRQEYRRLFATLRQR